MRCGNQTITYGELDGRANQVARHLQALGIGGEQLVGVSTYRSVDMMVAVLGVLKAGAAYVPLDPAYPDARLEFMVKDRYVETPIKLPDTFRPSALGVNNWLAFLRTDPLT